MGQSLWGKVIVITGGAQGIGARTAAALAREGARIAIGDLDLVRAEKTATELDNTIALPLDVTDLAGFTAFLDEVERRLGPIDVLINNAGIMLLSPFEEEKDAATVRQLEINVHAVMHGMREAIKRMRPRASGHIVNVASMAGKAGFPGAATYCATKHAVVGLSEAVRQELRGSGVEISCVMPAVVRTDVPAVARGGRRQGHCRGVETAAVRRLRAALARLHRADQPARAACHRRVVPTYCWCGQGVRTGAFRRPGRV